jgi:PPOX class probable F420-dependent enzyme
MGNDKSEESKELREGRTDGWSPDPDLMTFSSDSPAPPLRCYECDIDFEWETELIEHNNRVSHVSDQISKLSKHQYINLETYRKNGKAVTTPVWFTVNDNSVFVVTGNKTGKVKRLGYNRKVRFVPSGIRGQPKGEWLTGLANVGSYDLAFALNQRNKKYGFKAKLSRFFSRTKGDLVVIAISPTMTNGGHNECTVP